MRQVPLSLLFLFCFFSSFLFADTLPEASKFQYGPVPVLILRGDHTQMGIEYGKALKSQLTQELVILKQFYMTEHGISYDALVKQSTLFYDRFPVTYQRFLQGEAIGSGLSLVEVKILNAMETLGELLSNHDDVKCAFLFLPPNKTVTGKALIGRNYDYPEPFNQLAPYLTVTILQEKNTVPTAFISIAGEVYCPSCVNANGLFMELNNGTPSGGHTVDTDRQSLLINLLTTLQNSTSLDQIEKQMNATRSDFSLIINTASQNQSRSFEFSTNSTLGEKYFTPNNTQAFASTNFYLDSDWGNEIPTPTDESTWMGITRRNNLLTLANAADKFDVSHFENLMNTNITQGGADWPLTIYQLIFDESNLSLYVKINPESDTAWTSIPLARLFNA